MECSISKELGLVVIIRKKEKIKKYQTKLARDYDLSFRKKAGGKGRSVRTGETISTALAQDQVYIA